MLRFYCNSTTVIAGALFFAAPNIFAIVELGNGEIILDSKAAVEYDSNVFANSSEVSDLISSLTVGIAFEQSQRSVSNMMARFAVEAVRFEDLREFDTENLFFDFEFSYPNHLEKNFYYEFGGNWSKASRSRSETGEILESEEIGAYGAYRVYLNEKSGIRLSGNLGIESFNDSSSSDSEDVSATVDYLYRYSSKLDFVTGYRYHKLNYETDSSESQIGHAFTIGLDGKLLPKVEGDVSFGVQFLDASEATGVDDDVKLFYEIELKWPVSAKTWVLLNGLSDFQSSPDGTINNRRDLSVQLIQKLGIRAFGFMGLTYAQDSFEGLSDSRTDNSIILDGQYLHRFAENKELRLIAQYWINESDSARFEYDRLRLAINFIISF